MVTLLEQLDIIDGSYYIKHSHTRIHILAFTYSHSHTRFAPIEQRKYTQKPLFSINKSVKRHIIEKNLLNMLHNLITNILPIAKGVFAGEIVDNRLNPVHVAIATTGFRIQSGTLHIPHRIGFFSSGPPRLQVHEAASFIFLMFGSCVAIVWGGFVIFTIRLCGLPNSLKAGALMLSMVIAQAVVIWIIVCCDRRRVPGYEWEDWKLRKD